MKAEYALLLALVRNQMDGTAFQLPETVNWDELAKAARKHHLEPFMHIALAGTALPPHISEQFFAAYHKALFRDTQFDHVQLQVQQLLGQYQIPHVFMRGMCLKTHYPMSCLRTMSDMDILVRAEDLPSIRKAMSHTDAQSRHGDGNHRNYVFPQGVSIEFHPMLLHSGSPVGTGVNPGWQYVPEQSDFSREMSEEGFYLNVFCHFANHFFSGGAGIRFVLDIWICRHLRSKPIDRAFVEQELERVGLLAFAKKVEQLSDIWFSGEPVVPELEELADYICTSGLHGRSDRAQLNAICFSRRGTGLSALLGKAFYPKGDLSNRFDWVIGRPWLLPAAWIARAWFALTRRQGLIRQWHKGTQKYSREQIQQQKQLLAGFGLKDVGKASRS